MPLIAAFRGVRFNPERVADLSRVVTPPYDVIPPGALPEYYARSPYNMARIDLGHDEPGDGPAQNRYTRAGALFRQWLASGVLQVEPRPALYAYRIDYRLPTGEARQLHALVAAVCLARWQEREILPHEHTFAGPKADRLQLMRTTQAHLSSVYGFRVGESGPWQEALAQATSGPVAAQARDDDGFGHSLWVVTEEGLQRKLAALLRGRPVVVADGHHRYETALAYRDERAAADPAAPAEAGWRYVLMTLVDGDDPGLTILPTHRLLHRPLPRPWAEAKERLEAWWAVEEVSAPAGREALESVLRELAAGRVTCAFYLGQGHYALLRWRQPGLAEQAIPGPGSPAWKRLDVVALHRLALAEALGVSEAEQSSGQLLTYTRDAAQAVGAVDQGAATLACLLPAPTPRQVWEVAAAGDVMPHKSTYFYPKLLTGLVMSHLELPVLPLG